MFMATAKKEIADKILENGGKLVYKTNILYKFQFEEKLYLQFKEFLIIDSVMFL